jgi:PAS domain S-box-containing protein
LFQAVADGTPDAIFVKDRAGRYLLLNQAATRFSGKPVSEMIGQDATVLFDADNARRVSEHDRRVMEQNRPETRDEQLTAGGVTRTFQTTKAPYRDEHGNVIGVVGISRDITERIAMEQALRDREERYRSLFESSSDGIFVKKGGRIILANPVLLRMLGCDSAQQIIGKTPYDIIHSDYHDMVRERIRVLFEERQAVPFVEQKFVRMDGSTLEIEIAAVRFEDQGEIAIHVTARDITARKKAEAALRESEERFRQIAEHIQEVFWMADAEFIQTIYISPGYERVWGRTAESLYGDPKSFLDALHPEDRPRVIAALAAKRNRGGYCEQYRIIRPGGELRWIRDRAFPVHNEAGEVYRIVGLAEDITERQQAEEKLAQQHVELLHVSRLSTMGQMVAAMSHELSQPLTAANNFAAALAAQLDAPAEPDRAIVRGCNEAVIQQCLRAAAILQRLRDFGRKTPAQRTTCNLNKVLHDSAALVQNELARTNVRVQFDLAAASPEVEGDAIQLQQVIVNLLLNARDAMQATPPVDRVVAVRTEVAGAVTVIEFEDRGTGISADVAPHLFQPFFSTKADGMGIGLSICHTILEEHGGKIEARSNPHGGATFRCTLPVLKQPSDGSRAHRSRRG